jgi:uncharacterized protein YceH (UPF0502 family)
VTGLLALWGTRLGRYVLAAAGLALVALAALAGARRAGRQAERVDRMVTTMRQVEARREVERGVRRGRDGDAARELLDDWARD